MAASVHQAVLGSHAHTPPASPIRLLAEVACAAAGELTCTFILRAQLSRLALPPAAGPARSDELWRHTCFELFMSAPGESSYYEFNFAPSLAWAAYRFAGYRRGMQSAPLARAPRIRRSERVDELTLAATVATAGLEGVSGAQRLELGLAAVLEERDAGLSYWALRHHAQRPDFHQRDCFTLAFSCP
jgi:hypothetical protein